jgi:glycopeptide antibiotics resistance protein
MPVSRRLRRTLAAAAIGLVLLVLLAPHHTDLPITWLSRSGVLGKAADIGGPLWWAMEDVANIALFVPLGAVLARRLRAPIAWLIAVGVSVACETAQLWIPMRQASLRDVLVNAAGAGIGVGLVVLHRRLRTARSVAPQA